MRLWCALLLAPAAFATAVHADAARDVARIHVEAIGGRERIAGLQTLRARGTLETPRHTLQFELLAARPNRVHVTTTGGGQTVVQATDGEHTPWRLRPERSPVAQHLPSEEAVPFLAESEFDDPLVDPDARGYSLDFGGETIYRSRRALRILVTHTRHPPSVLLVDAENYFIVARQTERALPSGRTLLVETHFDNFMPTAGVIMPRLITVFAEGRQLQQTVIEVLEANPPLDSRQFAKPEPTAARQ